MSDYEPFGPEYVRPANADCPDCPCCTTALCGRGRASVLECAGHVDDAHRETVRGCPCSSGMTRGTLSWRASLIRAVTAAEEKPLTEDVEEFLRGFAAGTPLVGGMPEQLVLRGYVDWGRKAVTDAGRAYLDARSGGRTATQVLVVDVDEAARTCRVVVVGYSADATVVAPMDQLASSRTGLAARELPGKLLTARANCGAQRPEDVVLTRVVNPRKPAEVPQAAGLLEGLRVVRRGSDR